MPNEHAQQISQKTVRPTVLKSSAITEFWTTKEREAALFSAQTSTKTYLDKVKEILVDYEERLGKVEESDEDITQGKARARMQMYEALQEAGLVGEGEGDTKRITDLASSIRLNLIIDTNHQIAHSLEQLKEASDPIQAELNPCWELVRDEYRMEPRDWLARWQESANAINWEGVAKNTDRMIAKKDSPIWQRLGNYPDGLGNPYPPFAFGSGMGWEIVTREEAAEYEFD